MPSSVTKNHLGIKGQKYLNTLFINVFFFLFPDLFSNVIYFTMLIELLKFIFDISKNSWKRQILSFKFSIYKSLLI